MSERAGWRRRCTAPDAAKAPRTSKRLAVCPTKSCALQWGSCGPSMRQNSVESAWRKGRKAGRKVKAQSDGCTSLNLAKPSPLRIRQAAHIPCQAPGEPAPPHAPACAALMAPQHSLCLRWGLALALLALTALPHRAGAVKGISDWSSGLITHYGGAQDGETCQHARADSQWC